MQGTNVGRQQASSALGKKKTFINCGGKLTIHNVKSHQCYTFLIIFFRLPAIVQIALRLQILQV